MNSITLFLFFWVLVFALAIGGAVLRNFGQPRFAEASHPILAIVRARLLFAAMLGTGVATLLWGALYYTSHTLAYLLIWTIVFFILLPIGNQTADDIGEAVPPGTISSAPLKPRLLLKAGLATVISLAPFAIYFYLWSQSPLAGR